MSLRNEGFSFLGKPTIAKWLFYSGKISLFSGWGLFLAKGILCDSLGFNVPTVIAWLGVALLFLGGVILSLAFVQLGKALKVGLPTEDTTLQTSGLYRFSRNPIYLGVFLVSIAGCFYYPNPINIALSVWGMIAHFFIIKGEERFLEQRFGDQWLKYKQTVRRFL